MDETASGLRPSAASVHRTSFGTPSWGELLRDALVEVGGVSLVAACFLMIYVRFFGAPIQGALQHASILATLWTGLILARLLICRALMGNAIARWLNAVLVTGTAAFFLACAIGALVGLASWGRIPTWPLVRIYASQPSAFLQAVGLPPTSVLSFFLLAVVLVLFRLARPSSRIHWVQVVGGGLTRLRSTGVFLAIFTIFAIRLYAFASSPPVEDREPLSLIFFSFEEPPPVGSQSSRIRVLNSAEEAARDVYEPAREFRRRNVILIVGDALRGDRIGANGYARRTTPYIDSLVRSGVARSFKRVSSVCAESACGLKAIAQSRYPHEFAATPITLYEVLRRHGYSVQMVLGGDHTNFYGLRSAYGTVDEYVDGSMMNGYYVNDDAAVVDFTAKLQAWDGRPVLMQFHLMSAHALGTRTDDFAVFRPATNYYRFAGSPLTLRMKSIEEARNYYDNGVRRLDDVVRQLLAHLSAKGYLQDSIVVITADHGEMLGEHGLVSHGSAVYQEALEIPLVIASFGGGTPFEADAQSVASQVDIAPTVLRELQIPIPSTWDGFPLQQGQSVDRDFVYFQQGLRVGLLDSRNSISTWKYWVDLASREEFVFDLTADPEERSNLADVVPGELMASWRREVLEQIPSASLAN